MNLAFPIEPASFTTLAVGWAITFAMLLAAIGGLLLPLGASSILARARAALTGTVRYAVGCSSVFVWLTFALPLTVAAVAVGRSVYAASTATFTVTPDALVLDGDWWGREIPRSALLVQDAEVVDLARRPELQLVRRTFGTGLLGYNSGWFQTYKSQALVYATRTEGTVVVPTTLGYMLLLTPRDPEGLVAALKGDASPEP